MQTIKMIEEIDLTDWKRQKINYSQIEIFNTIHS